MAPAAVRSAAPYNAENSLPVSGSASCVRPGRFFLGLGSGRCEAAGTLSFRGQPRNLACTCHGPHRARAAPALPRNVGRECLVGDVRRIGFPEV